MTKHYCDACGDLLTQENAVPVNNDRLQRLERTASPGVMFTITTGWNGVWNAGDLCRYCVIDAVARLDDRPREASRA